MTLLHTPHLVHVHLSHFLPKVSGDDIGMSDSHPEVKKQRRILRDGIAEASATWEGELCTVIPLRETVRGMLLKLRFEGVSENLITSVAWFGMRSITLWQRSLVCNLCLYRLIQAYNEGQQQN